jgi:hypothetical protein
MQKDLHLMIDGKNYKWESQTITGSEIKQLGGIEPTAELFLQAKGHHEDELIHDEQQVDLTNPGIEKFYSKPKPQVVIIVNAREQIWDKTQISYDELVMLAYGNVEGNKAYTITYSNGPKENRKGFIVKGQSHYWIKNGNIIWSNK